VETAASYQVQTKISTAAGKDMVVQFHLLNLRMGGQTESICALADALAARGVRTILPLTGRIDFRNKEKTARYGTEENIATRLTDFFRNLADADPAFLHHVVLPSPAWSWLIRVIRSFLPGRSFVFQFEGCCVGFQEDYGRVLKWARRDPRYYLPRFFLNSLALARIRPGKDVNCIIATKLQRDELLSLNVPSDRIYRIPNLALPFSGEEKSKARRRLGLPAGGFIFGFAGALSHVKGIDVLASAYALFRTQHPQAGSVLAVAGIEKPFLAIRSAPGIHVMGVVDMDVFLCAVDLLVLPYRTLLSTTLLPSLILEAMSLATPVLTTHVHPLDEFAEEDLRLLFCNADDPEDLAAKMGEAMRDYRSLAMQGLRNREILRRLQTDRVDRHLRCYEACLAAS
jgi:glycosyltransferase involved in cell wall biosynthesis